MDMERIEVQQMLQRGLGEVLYRSEAGSILRDAAGGLLSDMDDAQALIEALTALGIARPALITVRSGQVKDTLCAHYALKAEPDTVFVYTHTAPPVWDTAVEIVPMPPQHLAEAAAHYDMMDNSENYLRERMQAGLLWAAVENGRLMGFIGVHSDGSMGMLEVLPAFRRRGLGHALESYAIAQQLRRGWTPFCHVMQGNTASEALQQKLGLTKAQRPAWWIWAEE
ncbi:MAG: GNAT family N-acetyltransferase [Oscillospiraceae bacterium]|nr:GNAT family N-acetyltransferase [Oscillospiraceae bacterium]